MTTEQTIQQTRQKMPVLPADPNKAMQQMMETIDDLRSLYLEENAALASADTKGFLRLQDRKINLAKTYQYEKEQLIERKDQLSHIDNALKKQLLDRQEEFAGIMAENLKSLDRMRRGVQRLNDRIMHSAREAAQVRNVNYSAKGRLNRNDRPVSIGVSESV